jgi:hypothetical protein
VLDRVGLRRALPQPPLLITESADEFERLCNELEQEIRPQGIIEQIYVADLVYIAWEIVRLRRCKAGIINTAFRTGLERVLYQMLRDLTDVDAIDKLVHDWFSNEEGKKAVADLLKTFQLDHSAIEAEAIRASAPNLEVLERMLSSLESRRNKALYHVAEYRATLAHQLRESTDKLIEAKIVPALESGTGKKSAA